VHYFSDVIGVLSPYFGKRKVCLCAFLLLVVCSVLKFSIVAGLYFPKLNANLNHISGSYSNDSSESAGDKH
jgi:hypothetical protein